MRPVEQMERGAEGWHLLCSLVSKNPFAALHAEPEVVESMHVIERNSCATPRGVGSVARENPMNRIADNMLPKKKKMPKFIQPKQDKQKFINPKQDKVRRPKDEGLQSFYYEGLNSIEKEILKYEHVQGQRDDGK